MTIDWSFLGHPLFVGCVVGPAGFLLGRFYSYITVKPRLFINQPEYRFHPMNKQAHSLNIPFDNISAHEAYAVRITKFTINGGDITLLENIPTGFYRLPAGDPFTFSFFIFDHRRNSILEDSALNISLEGEYRSAHNRKLKFIGKFVIDRTIPVL